MKRILGLLLLVLVAGCSPLATRVSTPPIVPSQAWYTLYFTHPGEAGTGLTIESDLVDSIEAAQDSIDLALYSFSLSSVADALIDASRRGVTVRAVMEADNSDSAQARRLVSAGIPLHLDTGEGLMHDKFVILDGREVWTGSMNLTITGAQEDANNWLRIDSAKLAADYKAEFEALFTRHAFGSEHHLEVPYPLVSLDGAVVEVYFSPNGDVSRRLVELIDEAEESVVFLASNFTSDPLTAALLSARARGLAVSGLMDANNAVSNAGSDYQRLLAGGIPVELDKDPGLMHHKVLIVDERIVVLGSYNFTASAEYNNDENLLIIHDPEMAARFLAEYRRLLD